MSTFADKTILIVDDEKSILELLSIMLGQIVDAKIITAESGVDAFEIIKNGNIDLVISDIRMPKGNGIDLLDNIKKLNPGIPTVVLITGFVSSFSEDDAKKKGAIAIIRKPFNFDHLNETVIKALSGEITS